MIPDTQIKPGVKTDHIQWANNFIRDRKPDKVIIIGDWWDMPSLSSWKTMKDEVDGQTYKADIESGMEALATLTRRTNARYYFCTGNHEHRITRYVEKFPVLAGSISTLDCDVEKFGIKRSEFLKPIKIDGVFYNHYFHPDHNTRNAHPSAKALLQRECRSCTMGHVQKLETAMQKCTDGTYIRGLIAGSFYQH